MSGRVSQRRLPLAGEVYPGTTQAPPTGRLRVMVGGVAVVAAVTDAWPWTLLSLARHRQVDMIPSLHQVAGGVAIAADAWVALDEPAPTGMADEPRALRARLYLVDALPGMAGTPDEAPADLLLSRDLAVCLGWPIC
ncbi:hypothetical protein [Nitrospirillum iridis]|uniref:Uncharacterized protein n=1 Tax=Nitrospirillum iridis TaxID=765888 RepID=A0A7X0AXU1_9PROT|nr:hypothetical protein [Nitrospirillum iridis]MBB6251732.1 hypothetical protein [Nitrospirillum iridis]